MCVFTLRSYEKLNPDKIYFALRLFVFIILFKHINNTYFHKWPVNILRCMQKTDDWFFFLV